ncbi:MAG TPA: LysR family transcriptional regulator [Sphingomicrobium sp.]|nr:LysR family transcriptional regulator [Sphingomicrobium sp.]
MNLRSLDLNLLLVFDAIYNERNISKAARKLHLSQPAVSNALTRLREYLKDPLFERRSQGMIPTSRAKAVARPIRQALDTLNRGLLGDDVFDFTNSTREFVIGVEDYGETIILPRLLERLCKTAPNISVKIRPEPATLLKSALREGEVDLALDYFPLREADYSSQCVLTDSLLSLARREHPRIGKRLSLNVYLAQHHVVLAPRTNTMPMIDLALSKRGRQRRIAVVVPHFLSMPVIVQSSDLICTLPKRMALLYAAHFDLTSYAVPLRIPRFPIYLLWHETADKDAGHSWFRNCLIDFCRQL